MPKYLMLLVIFLYSGCKSADFSSLPEPTQSIIKSCNACHGNKENPNKGPDLAGMQEWYFLEQVQNFKQDKRGTDGEIKSALMNAAAKSVPDKELKVIAQWFSDQNPVKNKVKMQGDLKTGEALYDVNCRGCHSSSIGRFFTGSPVIGNLEADYTLSQLKKFRDGKRTFAESNKHKEKMITVSKRFNDVQLKDIAAYLESKK